MRNLIKFFFFLLCVFNAKVALFTTLTPAKLTL